MISPLNIKNTLGLGIGFNNNKLIHTNQFMQEIKEDIEEFRVRKIKWAIGEMISRGETLTPYKIQLYAGVSGSDKEVRGLILKTLQEY